MPYILAGLLLFALTLRSGPLVQLVFCAFAVGFGVWQIWMRQARMRWTGAMFIAVGLYLASWYQPWWLVYFGAADAKATVARAVELGGKVLVPATEIPGMLVWGVLQDPAGAAFAVFQALRPAS